MSGFWHFVESGSPKVFESLDAVFRLDGEQVTYAKTRDVIRHAQGGKTYYVKRYTHAGKGLRAHLGRSRARAEWENLQLFRQLGIPAPRLVAFGEKRAGMKYIKGALVMHEIPNTFPLENLAKEPELLALRPWRLKAIKQLAHHIARMHESGFVHGDCYWRNFLVTLSDDPVVYCIDCPQGKKTIGPRLQYGIARDLACLYKDAHPFFSKTDMMRFFKQYSKHTKLTLKDKQLIKNVIRKAAKKLSLSSDA